MTTFVHKYLQFRIPDGIVRSSQIQGDITEIDAIRCGAMRGNTVELVEVEFELVQCPLSPWYTVSGCSKSQPRMVRRELSCKVLQSGKMGNKHIIKWS